MVDATMICPNCGALIPYRISEGRAVCKFCTSIHRIDIPAAPPRQEPAPGPAPAPTVDTLVERGMAYLHSGNWATARGIFQGILQTHPNDYRVYIGLLLYELRVTNENALPEHIYFRYCPHLQKVLTLAPRDVLERYRQYVHRARALEGQRLAAIPMPAYPQTFERNWILAFVATAIVCLLFFVVAPFFSVVLVVVVILIYRSNYKLHMKPYKDAMKAPDAYRRMIFGRQLNRQRYLDSRK